MPISRFAAGVLLCASLTQCCCEKSDPMEPGRETAEPDQSGPPPPGAIEATELNVRVRELMKQGNFNEALPLAERGSRLDKEAFGPNHKFVAQSLSVLGYVEMELGRYADAEAHFNEALPIQAAKIGTDDVEYARTLDNLGQVQGRTGRSFESEYNHRRTLAIREKSLPGDHPDVAESLSNLGLSLTMQGRFDVALPFVQRVYDRDRRILPDPNAYRAQSTNALGYVYMQLGDRQRARSLLEEALRMREALGAQLEAAQTVTNLARLDFLDGHFSEAAARLKQAAPILAAKLGEKHAAMGGVHAQLGRVYRVMGKLQDAERELLQAQSIWSAQLANTPGNELQRAQFGESLYGQETMSELSAARLLAGRPDEALAGVEEMRASALAELLCDSRASRGPTNVTEIRSLLMKDEAFLSIQWSTASVSAILIMPDASSATGVLLADNAEKVIDLQLQAEQLYIDLSKSAGALGKARKLGQVLFPASLLHQIEDEHKIRRLVVVADGPLSHLPFDLMTDVPEVAYVPSGTVMKSVRDLAQSKSKKTESAKPSILLVGPPMYENWKLHAKGLENPIGRGPALAAVQKRLHGALGSITQADNKAIRSLAESRGLALQCLDSGQATLRNVEASAKGKRILHFLAHGFSGTRDAPYASSLALDPPQVMNDDDYGFLTLDRLLHAWRGKLDDCRVVVLAACETQVGVPVGTNTFALPWGFLSAGSPTVIATLWPVDADATSQFMQRFYENLLGVSKERPASSSSEARIGGAMKPSSALAEARQWLRLHGKPKAPNSKPLGRETPMKNAPVDFSDPYFWAGFVLVGEPE